MKKTIGVEGAKSTAAAIGSRLLDGFALNNEMIRTRSGMMMIINHHRLVLTAEEALAFEDALVNTVVEGLHKRIDATLKNLTGKRVK